MFIQVVAQNPVHTGRTRAKRRFPNGQIVRMEVIDSVEDFYTDEKKQYGDMTRINREGYEAIKRDPVFSVLSDGETQGGVASELLDAVKRQAEALASKLAAADVEIARLKLANGKLEAELAALRAPAPEVKAKVEAKAKGKGDKE
jgi:hypothetical protein